MESFGWSGQFFLELSVRRTNLYLWFSLIVFPVKGGQIGPEIRNKTEEVGTWGSLVEQCVPYKLQTASSHTLVDR